MASATDDPPRRPRHTLQGGPGRDSFMMDFENDVLRCWDARKGIPRGPRRFEKQEWAALIMSQVFPHHSDVDWEEYVEWVSQGGGDAWFQEEARHEAQLLEGPLANQVAGLRGKAVADSSNDCQQKMIAVLDTGEFCPAHFFARKP